MRLIIFLLINSFLFARENPFLPEVKIKNPSKIEEVKEFSKFAFNFPEDSRILNKIKFTYTSVDGSLKEYSLKVGEKIDWHNVYMLIDAQKMVSASLENKQVEKKVEDENEIIKQAIKNSDENIENFKESKPFIYHFSSRFWMEFEKNVLVFKTDGKLLNHLALSNPDRIVFDFKLGFMPKVMKQDLDGDIIKQIYTGIHNNFYRIVIKLDGKYNYEVERRKNEYKIELN